MKHIIQYIGYVLTAIHAVCTIPAVASFAFSITVAWLLEHESDRVPARTMWGEIVSYAKKMFI